MIESRGRYQQWIAAAMVAIVACAATARAGITEQQTILVWHSGASTLKEKGPSELIRDAYIAIHPAVHEIDMNAGVPDGRGGFIIAPLPYSPPADMNNPSPTDMTAFHMTPTLYEQWRSGLLDYIDQINAQQPGEPVLCLVTTRGVPALIMTDFDVPANHINDCDFEIGGCGANEIPVGVVAGVESSLAMLAIGSPTHDVPGAGPNGTSHFGVRNPFYGSLTPLDEQVMNGCLVPRRPVYAVSRLDATAPTIADDLDGDGVREHHEAVILMLQRSANLTVNPYRVSIVGDGLEGEANFLIDRAKRGLRSLRDAGWCVFYDETDEFLHGAFDPGATQCSACAKGEDPIENHCATSAGIETQYTAWPEVFHVGFGRNHECTGGNIFGVNDNAPFCECVATTHARHYNAHPAGVFVSIESTNGRWLWDTRENAQGFSAVNTFGVIGIQGWSGEWIARSHGSFALVHAFGPDTAVGGETNGAYVGFNFLEQGWTWGEAALSTIERLGHSDTPLGDPLATVQVVIPEDVDNDGDVDTDDLLLVIQNQCAGARCAAAGPCPDCDVDGDGMINAADQMLVQEVLDRIENGCFLNDTDALAGTPPLVDDSNTVCGLFNSIRAGTRPLSADVLQQVLSDACDCFEADLNNDGRVDAVDVIELMLGR